MKTNTELLCEVLGWQGGTVHQCAEATGITARQIIDTNRNAGMVEGKSTSHGWFAVRTCSFDFNHSVNFPAHQGDLAFWMGAIRGHEMKLKETPF